MARNSKLERSNNDCPDCGSSKTYEDQHFRLRCKSCGYMGPVDGYKDGNRMNEDSSGDTVGLPTFDRS